MTRALLALALVAAPLAAQSVPASDAWLGRLPDGAEKRRFILDCTGCHQFDATIAQVEGQARTRDEWIASVRKMLGFAGATAGFPVIAASREPEATADWLVQALGSGTPASRPRPTATADVTEYLMPMPEDLPHDVAVDSTGAVIITGMFSHAMHRLDPASGRMEPVPIPVPKANPRAVELDARGDWFVLLGGPAQLARYEPGAGRWTSWPIGVYPHSLGVANDGAIWFNGHFTRAPELIGRVLPGTGEVETREVPAHPELAAVPGGPIPYELRLAPDGSVWGSELSGNRIFAHDPASGRTRTWTLPTPESGPRRFDIDAHGTLWIPAYAANLLVRFDPATERFTEIPLPLADALPYVVRVDHGRGLLWIGTGAADAVLRYDIASGRFTSYPLPSRGALVRHIAIDPRSHDVWLAYGASPGRIPARIARLRARD